MTWFWDTAAVAAGVGLLSGALVPRLIARIPEPEPDPEPELDPIQAADDETAYSRPLDAPKERYADVAASPGLAWRTAVACGLAAGCLGGRVGWHLSLLFLLYLVPVGAALSVVDWRTRYLPTWLIRPSYVVVGGLVLVAALATRDWDLLQTAVVGWLGAFGLYFLMAFLAPRAMGYGDVRLSGVLGMALGALGVPELVIGLYTGFLLGGIGGLLLNALRVFSKRHSPFGPYMVLGAWLAAAFTPQLGAAYAWLVAGIASGLTTLFS